MVLGQQATLVERQEEQAIQQLKGAHMVAFGLIDLIDNLLALLLGIR